MDNADCIYWPSGCGQPILKSPSARRTPTDFYHPSFCPFCREYKEAQRQEVHPKVIVRYEYIKEKQSKEAKVAKGVDI